MLKLNAVSCGYEDQMVIKDITFDIKPGQNIAIVGPNGCGKTTLLRAIANLLPYEGSIEINSEEGRMIKRKNFAKKVALMTQSADIYFPYTVYETVALGRYAHSTGLFSSLSQEDDDMIMSCIEKVGLLDYKETLISELSGGQLQRVYLARAFAQDPDILLLDEPTNHLDLKYQIEILQHIKHWTKEHNKTVIGVLHDLNLVQMFSEEVILMKEGQIVEKGICSNVLAEQQLIEVYGINIKQYMIKALEKWQME